MKIEDSLIVAKPYLCVPAILETTLKYYGIFNFDQEKIASNFEIFVPPNFNSRKPYYHETIDSNKWGIVLKDYSINTFFRNNSIPLRETFISIYTIYDEFNMKDLIEEMLKIDSVMICGYNYSAVFGENDSDIGHVSIIKGLKKGYEDIILLDPGPKNPGLKSVNSYDLYNAIKRKKDGICIISSNSQ